MPRRRGPSLTPQQVLDAALEVVATEGAEALGISRVARQLGIKPASMYNHVASGEALARLVVLEGHRGFLEALKTSVRGVLEPRPQLRALAHAVRRWVTGNAGLYTLMARVEPMNDDPEAWPVYRDTIDLFARPLGQLGIRPDDQIHAVRVVRASLHGFVLLETHGQFGLPQDVEESYAWLIDAMVEGLTAAAAASSRPAAPRA